MGGDHLRSFEEWVGSSSRKFSTTKEGAKKLALQRRRYNIKMIKKRLLTAERRLRRLEDVEIEE